MNGQFKVSKIVGTGDWTDLGALLDATTEGYIERLTEVDDGLWEVLLSTGLRDERDLMRGFRGPEDRVCKRRCDYFEFDQPDFGLQLGRFSFVTAFLTIAALIAAIGGIVGTRKSAWPYH
jgi:hypothetical protein